mmetsp:Transcript_28546/g.77351  ORF Transcript_28546/g.77351 Transcript_28546/m.77351 type:complete len:319 (-) Transcript_28546:19-975(-)
MSGHNAKRVCWLAALLFIPTRLVFQFENAADLKFFGHFGPVFRLWCLFQRMPDTYLTKSCDDMMSIFESQTPILFKHCIRDELTVRDFRYFVETSQNLFPPCHKKVARSFEFAALDGSVQPILEVVPCNASTLRQKMDTFESHKTGVDGSYFDVHTYMLSGEEVEQVKRDLRQKSLIPDGFEFLSTVTALTYFMHAGTTAVYYLHSHMDRFLSFNVKEEKIWEVINPKYHDRFAYQWSGNANMILQELEPAPRVVIKQEKGDVLYIPPWWIHTTRLSGERKNLGFNIHMLSRGQFLGVAAGFFQRLGVTDWFYRNAAA